jgi:short-subunit dehydrogenase
MSFDWSKQTVVITGAYGGLGSVLCQDLAKKGAKLIITGRNTQQLEALKTQLPKDTHTLAGDVADKVFQKDLTQLLQINQSQGHVLINNAGISNANFIENQEDEEIKKLIDVNLLAPILLSKKLLPWLGLSQAGKIINIGSTFGAIGYPGFSSYCASKFGLRGFSQALNRELSNTTISVHYLAPRAIATTINSSKVDELNTKLKNSVDTPQQIVPQIINAIEKGKIEKFFGFPEKLFAKINTLFPSIVSNAINKEHTTIKQTLSK